MPRRFIKRFLPDHNKIREHKHLRFLRPLLYDPNLLHLNRRSVSGAFAVGLFIAWIPVPFQMVLAAGTAAIVKVNLPLSVALVWVSNPITMPPLFYFAYKLGSWLLDTPAQNFDFELSFQWLSQSLSYIWQPFLFGCLLMAAVSALFGSLFIRGLWRFVVVQRWQERQNCRRAKDKINSSHSHERNEN